MEPRETAKYRCAILAGPCEASSGRSEHAALPPLRLPEVQKGRQPARAAALPRLRAHLHRADRHALCGLSLAARPSFWRSACLQPTSATCCPSGTLTSPLARSSPRFRSSVRSSPALSAATRRLRRLLGMLVTTLAVALGAPFWYHVLNLVVNVRTAETLPRTSILSGTVAEAGT